MKKLNSPNRRGATAVEVALCLPLLFLFLFASFELASANMLRHACESAAYEGARVGIVPGVTEAKIENAVGFVMGSVGASKYDVTVTPQKIDSNTKKVTVEVEAELRENSIMSHLFIGNLRLRGSCELTREVL
jgi:Flp pilus assembly protein TadG